MEPNGKAARVRAAEVRGKVARNLVAGLSSSLQIPSLGNIGKLFWETSENCADGPPSGARTEQLGHGNRPAARPARAGHGRLL
jgi:hypothetical protein